MRDTLGGFLRGLEAAGELRRIAEPVSPILEVTRHVQREVLAAAPTASVAAAAVDPGRERLGGQALLFENVTGCDFPLAINIYGSYHRTELALGCATGGGLETIARRIESLVHIQPPTGLRSALAKGREFLPLLRVGPKRRRGRGPCQEVIRLARDGDVDLTRLPLIKCWPLDGDPAAVGWPMTAEQAGTAGGDGRYITFGGMHTIHARDADAARPASHNIGMYRAQLLGPDRLAMHWHVHHDGAAHWRSWKRAGKPMPIAICLGGEAVMPYAATCPLPPGISELLMAGFLHGRGIPLVRARTVPLWVPANSEIVIEGWVRTDCGAIDFDPARDTLGPGAVLEGPFGDHTGFYSLPDRYPEVAVTAVTHRRDAVYPTIIVGGPPQEDYYLGKATERIFRPLLQTLIPDLVDYHLPLFGCFHNCAFVQIRKAYPLQARRVMHAVWGAGQMAWTKIVVVVDSDVDVHDEGVVLAAICRHTHFGRDLEIVNGPLDILDHAAPRLGAGHKIGIDATAKVPGEEVGGIAVAGPITPPSPMPVAPTLPGVAAAAFPDFGRGRCLFLAVDKHAPGAGAAAIAAAWDAMPAPAADLVIAVDAAVDVHDRDAVLFHLGAQCDPGRDRHHGGARVGFDATTKLPGDERNGEPVRAFPPILALA